MQLIRGLFDSLAVAALESLFHFLNGGLHFLNQTFIRFVPEILDGLLRLVDKIVRVVFDLDGFLLLFVLRGVRFGFFDHAVDIFLAHAAVRLNRNLLLLTGAQILRRNVDNTVCVDIELDLDLRHAARRGGNIRQLEPPQRLIPRGHLALALQNVNIDRRLIIGRRRKHLTL